MKTPTTKKPRPGSRKHQILDAALSCFLRQGVEVTTIEEIRRASGASLGSIYHHFGSKEAIALAVYSELIEDYQAHALAALRRETAAREGIRAVIAAHLGWVQSNANRSLYLTRVEIADPTGPAAGRIAAYLQGFAGAVYAWLRPFIDRGEVVAIPPALTVPLILGPTSSFARQWLAHRLDLDTQSVVDTLAEAAWNSLRGPATPPRRPPRRPPPDVSAP